MTTEGQLSSRATEGADTLVADPATQGTLYHLVVRISAGTPIGSGDDISERGTARHVAAAKDESSATILVPLGELDYFSVQRVTDAADGLMVGTYRSVTFDLSAVSFCDSSIGSFFDWVDGLGGEISVTVITSPAIEHVLGLLAGDAQ